MDRIASPTFEPIYGWGWRQGDGSVEVPEPFELAVESGSASVVSGVVQAPHQFAGCLATLCFRGQAGDTLQWGVVLSGGSLADVITGYVQSTGNTSNNSFKPKPLRGSA